MSKVLRIILTIYVAANLISGLLPWRILVPPDFHGLDKAHWREQIMEPADRVVDYPLIAFGWLLVLLVIVMHFASVVGLYRLRRWGLYLYTASLAVLVLLTPLFGSWLLVNWQTPFDTAANMAAGAVIAIGFCTNAIGFSASAVPATCLPE
jgi:hypothetical protein